MHHRLVEHLTIPELSIASNYKVSNTRSASLAKPGKSPAALARVVWQDCTYWRQDLAQENWWKKVNHLHLSPATTVQKICCRTITEKAAVPQEQELPDTACGLLFHSCDHQAIPGVICSHSLQGQKRFGGSLSQITKGKKQPTRANPRFSQTVPSKPDARLFWARSKYLSWSRDSVRPLKRFL